MRKTAKQQNSNEKKKKKTHKTIANQKKSPSTIGCCILRRWSPATIPIHHLPLLHPTRLPRRRRPRPRLFHHRRRSILVVPRWCGGRGCRWTRAGGWHVFLIFLVPWCGGWPRHVLLICWPRCWAGHVFVVAWHRGWWWCGPVLFICRLRCAGWDEFLVAGGWSILVISCRCWRWSVFFVRWRCCRGWRRWWCHVLLISRHYGRWWSVLLVARGHCWCWCGRHCCWRPGGYGWWC